jgi:catechol 2,3-dioxygenase-like lactoylglutathione lyase family enzyme
MPTELNHLIVPATDKWASARFLAVILGREPEPQWAHFVPVRLDNGVTIDFSDATDIHPQHLAFLVGEADFDAALARIKASGIEFHAEFDGSGRGEINRLYGGRGVYFNDPDGHQWELITRPYGAVPEQWIEGRAVQYSP